MSRSSTMIDEISFPPFYTDSVAMQSKADLGVVVSFKTSEMDQPSNLQQPPKQLIKRRWWNKLPLYFQQRKQFLCRFPDFFQHFLIEFAATQFYSWSRIICIVLLFCVSNFGNISIKASHYFDHLISSAVTIHQGYSNAVF